MGQSTEMSPLVSMLLMTFVNALKFLMEFFDKLVCLLFRCYTDALESLKNSVGRRIYEKMKQSNSDLRPFSLMHAPGFL